MSDACKGCAKSSECSPDEQQQCDGKDTKLNETLSRIKHKIVVLSGKGGVGKSTVAVNIAVGLALAGKKVGLLDVDIHGPSVPRLLSLQNQPPHAEEGYIEPISWTRNLWVMSLGLMIPSSHEAVVWRGPVKIGMIRRFVEDVAWGDLDYLIVDCPPGTGDEPLSVMQLLGDEARAVIVTTPQGVAVDDVRRSVTFVRLLDNPILGIVENMSGFVCPDCKSTHEIFRSGGGQELAQEMNVPFLGKIPIDPEVARSGDEGYVFVKTHPDSAAGQAVKHVLEPILALDD